MNVHQTVTCPYEWCAAKPGQPCKDKRGFPIPYQHKVRSDAATAAEVFGSLGGGERD